MTAKSPLLVSQIALIALLFLFNLLDIHTYAEEANEGNSVIATICSERAGGQEVSVIDNSFCITRDNGIYNKDTSLLRSGDFILNNMKYSGTTCQVIGYCKAPEQTKKLKSPVVFEEYGKLYFSQGKYLFEFSLDCKYECTYDVSTYDLQMLLGKKTLEFGKNISQKLLYADSNYLYFLIVSSYSEQSLVRVNKESKKLELIYTGWSFYSVSSKKPLFSCKVEHCQWGENHSSSDYLIDCSGSGVEVISHGMEGEYVMAGNQLYFETETEEYAKRNVEGTVYKVLENGNLQELFSGLKGKIVSSDSPSIVSSYYDMEKGCSLLCFYNEDGTHTTKELFKGFSAWGSGLINGRMLVRCGSIVSTFDVKQGALTTPFQSSVSGNGIEGIYDDIRKVHYLLNVPILFAVKDGSKEYTQVVLTKEMLRDLEDTTEDKTEDDFGQFVKDVCLFHDPETNSIYLMIRKYAAASSILKVDYENGKIQLSKKETGSAPKRGGWSGYAFNNPVIRKMVMAKPDQTYLGTVDDEHFVYSNGKIAVLDDNMAEKKSYQLDETFIRCKYMLSSYVVLAQMKGCKVRGYNLKTGAYVDLNSSVSSNGKQMVFANVIGGKTEEITTCKYDITTGELWKASYSPHEKRIPCICFPLVQGPEKSYAIAYDNEFSTWITIPWKKAGEKEKQLKAELNEVFK